MKTITIPTKCNPCIVVINNHVYAYKAGETVEGPDEVAEAIKDALELEPKPKRHLGKFAQLAEGTLTKITAEDLDGIKTIAYYAFGQSYALKSIEFPNSITGIAKSAVTGCVNLESVSFGDNLYSIGENAFYWCSNLATVYLPTNPPILENANAFSEISDKCVFYCKTQASLDAYKKATNWSTLTGTYSFVVEA